MDNAQAYGLLIALLLPFLAGLLTKATWPSWLRFSVLVALSGAVGAGTLYYSGELVFTADTYLVTVAAIVGASQTAYYVLIKATGLKPWLDGMLVN